MLTDSNVRGGVVESVGEEIREVLKCPVKVELGGVGRAKVKCGQFLGKLALFIVRIRKQPRRNVVPVPLDFGDQSSVAQDSCEFSKNLKFK